MRTYYAPIPSYPGCYVYFKGWEPIDKRYTINYTSMGGVIGYYDDFQFLGGLGYTNHGKICFEYDNYANRWRVWDIHHMYSQPGPQNPATKWWAPSDRITGATVYTRPQWLQEGDTSVVYRGASIVYMSKDIPWNGQELYSKGFDIECEIVKTCSGVPTFPGVIPGGTTYTIRDSFPTANLTGHPRLETLQPFLTGFNAYSAAAVIYDVNMDAPANGTLTVPVNNNNDGLFYWTASNGTIISERVSITTQWSVSKANATAYNLTLTGTFPAGTGNAPGIGWTKSGVLTLPTGNSTVTGNTTVTWQPPAGVTATGTGRAQTTGKVTPHPVHKILKVTLLDDTVRGTPPAGYKCPVAIDNAKDSETYIYRTGQAAAALAPTVLGAMYWPIPTQYHFVPNPTSSYPWGQSHTRRVFNITGTVEANTSAAGASYRITMSKIYNHAPFTYTSDQTTYTFTSNMSSVLPMQIGANTTVNLTTSYSGTTRQTVEIGRARIEVLEV